MFREIERPAELAAVIFETRPLHRYEVFEEKVGAFNTNFF